MDNMVISKDNDDVTISEVTLAELCFDYFVDGINYANQNISMIVKDMAYNAQRMQGAFAKANNEMKENKDAMFKAFFTEFKGKHGRLLRDGRKKIILPV